MQTQPLYRPKPRVRNVQLCGSILCCRVILLCVYICRYEVQRADVYTYITVFAGVHTCNFDQIEIGVYMFNNMFIEQNNAFAFEE